MTDPPVPTLTQSTACTVEAGEVVFETRAQYCTNNPNNDHVFSLPNYSPSFIDALLDVTVSAEFSRGWTGETVYDHLATLSLNNTPLGSAIVPGQSRIEGTLSPTALVMSGPRPRQVLNVRSDHTNQAHFTVASDFQMTLNFGPHVQTQCFSVEELQIGALDCQGDLSLRNVIHVSEGSHQMPELLDANDGICTLREAIQSANNGGEHPDGTDCRADETDSGLQTDEIAVEVFPDVIYEYDDPLPIVEGAIMIRVRDDAPENATIKRLDSASPFRILQVATTGSLILDNIVVTNGWADEGGGILNEGTLVLQNGAAVKGNRADSNGGGIYSAGTLTLQNNSGVERNRATGNGAGIYNVGILTVTNSRIQENVIPNTSGHGGGIYSDAATNPVSVTGSCIVFNTSWGDGGGIYNNSALAPVTAFGNWWGHPAGPTYPDTDNPEFPYEGAEGDAILGVSQSDHKPDPAAIAGVTDCLKFDPVLIGYSGRAGRPELALENYIRVSQILGREIELEEVFAFIAYKGGGTQGYDDTRTGYLTQAVGRYFFEFQISNRNPSCPPEVDAAYQQWISTEHSTANFTGFLCFLGNYSEWFGENIRSENWVYEIKSFVEATIDQDSTPSDPNSSTTWRQRAAIIIAQLGQGLDSLDESGICESNLTTGHGVGGHRNCPWLWGNYSTLSARSTSRLSSVNNRIRLDAAPEDPLRPSQYFSTVFSTEEGIVWKFASIHLTNAYGGNTETQLGITVIFGSQVVWGQDFFFFTYNQDRPLKCPNDLTRSGDFPIC